MKTARLATLGPRLAVADLRTAHVPDKRAAPHYHTPEHRAWSRLVIDRAGGRCEDPDASTGLRCTKSEANGDRMFADRIVEFADNGAPFDPANGKCRCGKHHTLKTNTARGHPGAQGSRVETLAQRPLFPALEIGHVAARGFRPATAD
jgi:5-methylcytosine-specific restriction protein A